MREIKTVFQHQLTLFRCEKGMHIYYLILILILGYISPLFLPNLQTCTTMTVLTAAMLTKQLLVDSFALEKEQRTLESLLSTPISIKHLLRGKSLFCFAFSTIFFSFTLFGIVLFSDRHILATEIILVCSILTFYMICKLGTYASLNATNTAMANRKISMIVYPLIFLLIVIISTLFTGIRAAIVISLCVFVIITAMILITFQYVVFRKTRYDLFEKQAVAHNKSHEITSLHTPRSQVSAVFRHEAIYFCKLHYLQLNYLLLVFAPAIIVCLFSYNDQKVNLSYAVVLTALMMPRIPMNLVSYAIGGEKAYKTGESLLSTPIRISSMFLGKSLLPILVSAVILVSSSFIAQVAAGFMHLSLEGNFIFYHYTTVEMILIYPVTMLSCLLMIFLTGILSAVMKTPRYGLYASSVLSSLFVLPVFLILCFTGNPLYWSILYGIVLLFCNIGCLIVIAEKISRPKLMSRL